MNWQLIYWIGFALSVLMFYKASERGKVSEPWRYVWSLFFALFWFASVPAVFISAVVDLRRGKR